MSLAAEPEEHSMRRLFRVTHRISMDAAWRCLLAEANGCEQRAAFQRRRFLSAEKWAQFALSRGNELLRARARATKSAIGGSEHE